MIYVTHRLPVNEAGEPTLDRSAVWQGLVMKANNALPFVPIMTHCVVTALIDDETFDREIELFGDRYIERISLQPERRVVFTRLSGPVLGTISNDIEEDEGALFLRFSFALVLESAQSGSPEESAYADETTKHYIAAVGATLNAMRRVARGESSVALPAS
ncbi:SRPBCC family protein [Nocardia sp. NPDC050793]|uniref:SRPBCC family protein n=1 Tax=Nocardia sp. NPDC050793 TaxID=3155159 RepID=UPI0034063788